MTFDQNLNWRAQLEVLTPGALCKIAVMFCFSRGGVRRMASSFRPQKGHGPCFFARTFTAKLRQFDMHGWVTRRRMRIEYQREQYNCRLCSGGGELGIVNFRYKFPWNVTRWLNLSVKMNQKLLRNINKNWMVLLQISGQQKALKIKTSQEKHAFCNTQIYLAHCEKHELNTRVI